MVRSIRYFSYLICTEIMEIVCVYEQVWIRSLTIAKRTAKHKRLLLKGMDRREQKKMKSEQKKKIIQSAYEYNIFYFRCLIVSVKNSFSFTVINLYKSRQGLHKHFLEWFFLFISSLSFMLGKKSGRITYKIAKST